MLTPRLTLILTFSIYGYYLCIYIYIYARLHLIGWPLFQTYLSKPQQTCSSTLPPTDLQSGCSPVRDRLLTLRPDLYRVCKIWFPMGDPDIIIQGLTSVRFHLGQPTRGPGLRTVLSHPLSRMVCNILWSCVSVLRLSAFSGS